MQRGTEPLARFILTLAYDDNGIGDYVRTFIAADDPSRSVQRLRESLAVIRAGERAYDYRHKRSDVFLRRLDHVLDSIELIVLPRDPQAAFDLLVQAIESDDAVANHCHESDIGCTFDRACRLLISVAETLRSAEVDATITRLAANDPYGARRLLRANTA